MTFGLTSLDFASRLRLALPGRWFSDVAPVLDGLLTGLGAGWATLFGLLDEVRLLSRLRTITGVYLDLAGADYFGARLLRRLGEEDGAYRGRIIAALLRGRVTRAAVIEAAVAAGGVVDVFEAAQPGDTGVYGGPGLGWGVAGGWGSLLMPLEALVTMRANTGVADVRAAIAEALPAGGAAWVRG